MKRIVLILIVVLILGGGAFFFISQQQSSENPLAPISTPNVSTEKIPSATVKEYSDSSGFSFNYPDDLSLEKNENASDSSYADLKLKSDDVDGNLSLKIQDTKLVSADAWFKENSSIDSGIKEVKWGILNAKVMEDSDKMQIAAVDQGILFTMEVTFGGEKDFWQAASSPILSSFAFNSEASQGTAPQTANTGSDDVVLEGEEVVE